MIKLIQPHRHWPFVGCLAREEDERKPIMFYFEAPDEETKDIPPTKRLFLAGGITDCPDWQREMRERLINTHLTVFNPRRAIFPMDDPTAAEQQITWEHKYLRWADAILFWFPCETLCPIVLFELGAWAYSLSYEVKNGAQIAVKKPLFVGVHPDYKRKQDVIIQLQLERPDVEVVETLEDLAWQIKQWHKLERVNS